MKLTVIFTTLVALASAKLISPDEGTVPFSLAIISESETYNGSFIAGAVQDEAYTAATVSSALDSNFYYESRTGVLYHQVSIFAGGFTDISLALAATFPTDQLPGQHLKLLSFQQEHDDNGDLRADVTMGFDAEGYLTHQGKRDVWYACSDAKHRVTKEKYTAIELLIGDKPNDSDCTKVEIKQLLMEFPEGADEESGEEEEEGKQ
ncbi:hypothetical protein Dda_6612 [Drechslerella dactyloides]|uniref:Uncharacterized protein n=1 Tax=Drechslerella dactyloides TaxID=74499 RepID=A0AAD6NGC7_DREDA|nr:hypothetical protein Dda_6612 [Drechslerella dactyloides]